MTLWFDDFALLLRWFHLVIGIGWIGASFYFVWLNNAVRPPSPPNPGVAGELWSVHGGAFYRVVKAAGAPSPLPDPLHWFQWEAYLTWLSGLCLLILGFWMQPAAMVDPSVASMSGPVAAAVGAATLAFGWVVYDLACRTLSAHPLKLASLLSAYVASTTFVLFHLLSPRAALLHVGAMLGTWMAANVWTVIIPGQRAMVAALVAGKPPPLERGAAGALRSLHNNYLTFPVLFTMLGGHFPGIIGHTSGWAIVLGLFAASLGVKHHLNLHERGESAPWALPFGLILAVGSLYAARPAPSVGGTAVPVAKIQQIIAMRCLPCHATAPFQTGFSAPPKNLVLETPTQIDAARSLIRAQVVTSHIMPLGNLTGMTEEERVLVDRWSAP